MSDGNLLGKAQPDLSNCGTDETRQWELAASPLGITPFEAKALYAMALIRQLAEGTILMWSQPGPLELPGLVILASGIEALGRCVRGCREEWKDSGLRLTDGIDFMLRDCGGKIVTPHGAFDSKALKGIRNFTTHGGTTPTEQDVLSPVVSRQLLNSLGHALTDYWTKLGKVGEPLRDKLSDALIRPLGTRGQVIFVKDMRDFIIGGAMPGAGIQWRDSSRPTG